MRTCSASPVAYGLVVIIRKQKLAYFHLSIKWSKMPKPHAFTRRFTIMWKRLFKQCNLWVSWADGGHFEQLLWQYQPYKERFIFLSKLLYDFKVAFCIFNRCEIRLTSRDNAATSTLYMWWEISLGFVGNVILFPVAKEYQLRFAEVAAVSWWSGPLFVGHRIERVFIVYVQSLLHFVNAKTRSRQKCKAESMLS